ncbi:hypothetical protein GCM10028793_25000 [Nocardiopsis oceani]
MHMHGKMHVHMAVNALGYKPWDITLLALCEQRLARPEYGRRSPSRTPGLRRVVGPGGAPGTGGQPCRCEEPGEGPRSERPARHFRARHVEGA